MNHNILISLVLNNRIRPKELARLKTDVQPGDGLDFPANTLRRSISIDGLHCRVQKSGEPVVLPMHFLDVHFEQTPYSICRTDKRADAIQLFGKNPYGEWVVLRWDAQGLSVKAIPEGEIEPAF